MEKDGERREGLPGDEVIADDSTPGFTVERVDAGQGHEGEVRTREGGVAAAGTVGTDAGDGHEVVHVAVVADVRGDAIVVVDPM